ncbi:hypothetical protein [Streptomyces oceani]|uniref:hypothetical protein n=1 Tax=Streptomyces oceani TaxID=1075402 RepID=UPI00087317EC|nr:hypothetical protein [Streptomyces oceani]
MEPRQLWDRNTVLAEAFCRSDDEVKDAQGTLDDARATRARFLAAFAVTLRNDSAVADLLGLAEREVRIARRTVSKDDARAVADELLAVPESPPRLFEERGQGTESPGGAALGGAVPGAQAGGAAVPEMPEYAPAGTLFPGAGTGAGAEPVWSAAMDAVLIGGWQSGVDLRVLANEFGLDLHRLVTRAQQLSVQGRLGPARGAPGWEASGRHRRGAAEPHAEGHTHIPSQQTTAAGWDNRSGWEGWSAGDTTSSTAAATFVPGGAAQQGWHANFPQGWGPDARRFTGTDSAGGTQDWQGILHEWGDTPPVREDVVQYQQVYEQTFQQPVAQYGQQQYEPWQQYT